MKYFIPRPETLDELKSVYRALAFKFHPDIGGDTEVMKVINDEYDRLFETVKNIHRNHEGKTYTKESTEAPENFRDIINSLFMMKMQDVEMELIGSFLWLSGCTKLYRDKLKALGFKWSTNKSAWYLAPAGYRRRNRKNYTMNDIRGMYGSASVAEERIGVGP